MKKPRGKELEKEDKAENKIKHGKRAVVENCFHVFKRWAILDDEYRGKYDTSAERQRVTQIVHVIGAIVKHHLVKHPLRADPAATV